MRTALYVLGPVLKYIQPADARSDARKIYGFLLSLLMGTRSEMTPYSGLIVQGSMMSDSNVAISPTLKPISC